jgi:hypothetical protein
MNYILKLTTIQDTEFFVNKKHVSRLETIIVLIIIIIITITIMHQLLMSAGTLTYSDPEIFSSIIYYNMLYINDKVFSWNYY